MHRVYNSCLPCRAAVRGVPRVAARWWKDRLRRLRKSRQALLLMFLVFKILVDAQLRAQCLGRGTFGFPFFSRNAIVFLVTSGDCQTGVGRDGSLHDRSLRLVQLAGTRDLEKIRPKRLCGIFPGGGGVREAPLRARASNNECLGRVWRPRYYIEVGLLGCRKVSIVQPSGACSGRDETGYC